MTRQHIIAAKEIRECKCPEGKCRAKHGSYLNRETAEAALQNLISPQPVAAEASPLVIPVEEAEATDPAEVAFPAFAYEETYVPTSEPEIQEYLVEDDEPEVGPGLDTSFSSDEDYWNDDEEFLRGDDKVLVKEQDSALFKQAEGVIRWDLSNFFDEEGKRRGKYSLRQDPPVLRIQDSGESVVEFVLTREVTYSLYQTLETVHRGYYGVGPKREKGDPKSSKAQELIVWFERNPIKGFMLVGLLAVTLLLAVAI